MNAGTRILVIGAMLTGGVACLTGDDIPATERQVGRDMPSCPSDPLYPLSWHCNQDAELLQGGAQANDRDECDSDPCGLSDIDTESWSGAGGQVQFTSTNVFATDGRRLAGTDDLRTGWRFCWCPAAEGNTVADREACLDAEQIGIYEAGACNIADLAEFAQGDGAHWRSMSLTKHFGGGAIGATTDLTYDGPAQRDGGSEGGLAFYPDLKWSIRVDWDIDADAEDWYELLDLAGYDMPGVLWTHTPGPTGEGDFSTDLRERTSNYFSGWYGLDHGLPTPDTDTDIGVGSAPVPRRSLCRSCSTSFPRPFLLIPDCLGLQGCTDPAELRFDTMVQNAIGLFTGGAQNGLGQVAGKWSAATEPDLYQGTTGVRYAAIATNGTTVNSVLTLGAAGLSRTTPANNGTKPSSRSLHGAVVSVVKNRIWVMGGINGSGGLLQDLYAYNIGTQTWSQVSIPGSYKPSRVLAATYSVDEDRLLVLDQTTAGGSVRLIRIDPNGSASSQLVGTWSRTASTTTFGLSAEVGHRAYTVACGGSSSHALLRLRRSGSGVTLWKTATGTGALASGQVQASVEGLSYLAQVSGVPRARGVYYRDMSSGGSVGLCF